MAKKITTQVKLEDIYFDLELYPRSKPSWQTAYVYSQNILSGAKFPPIVLALYQGKKILVDGKHRQEAHKLLKKKSILAEVHVGWNKKRIFEEAIRRNNSHGQVLSPYEKRMIGLKLRNMKYSNKSISELISVPQDKLHTFIGQRLVSSTTGDVLVETIVKSAFKHRAGTEISPQEMEQMDETQGQSATGSQIFLIKQLSNMFENDLIDLNDAKVYENLLRLKEHLKSVQG